MVEDRLPIDEESQALQFRLHLHRGIAYLASEQVKKIDSFAEKAVEATKPQIRLPGS
jgi:hypothetical protein